MKNNENTFYAYLLEVIRDLKLKKVYDSLSINDDILDDLYQKSLKILDNFENSNEFNPNLNTTFIIKVLLKVNDEIEWHIFGDSNWYKTKIVGLNRDPQSQSLNMTREFYESLGLDYKPDSIYTNENLENVKELDGAKAVQNISEMKSGMENMLGTMKALIVIMVVVAGALGMVIIYNLGILSLSEKHYQFATLKVLGFKDKQIKNIFTKQNIWLTIIGVVLGLPLGFYMTDFIFRMALSQDYDFGASIRIWSYLYAVVGILVVSFVVNKRLAKKVDTIDMVTSLKANE